MHRSSRSWLAYITLGLAHLLLAGAAGAQSPRAILEATGVKGGLIVHVPCGDGTLTTALRVNDRFLVHGLDTDAANVAQARARAQSLGLHGEATFSVLKGRRLPFIDNTVNLLVSEGLGGISTREVMRILAPDGVAYVKRNGQWTSTPKPRPREIDDWTHFLHGPDGNPVARDLVVGPPFHMQWVGAPSHSKSHSHLASINVIVSAGGRIFYFVDEGPTALPHSLASQWNLVARDAFNGVTLWRRPLSSWQPADLSGRNFFPVDLFRRLVTDGQRVYATLSIFGPVVALDPATGETIRTYEGTENTEEIICHEGTLFLVVGTTSPDDIDRRALAQRRGEPAEQRIMAISAETGSVLWEKRGRDTNGVMPMTLAARGERVFFQNTENVICLEARTGDELWRSPRPASYARPSWSAPTLVVHDDVVLCADRGAATAASARTQNRAGQTRSGDLVVLSAKTGERLWSSPCAEGCRSPIDVFVANGRVWLGEEMARKPSDYLNVRNVLTGEVVRDYPPRDGWVDHHHHRCYRDKATERYILAGRTGVEFIDTKTGKLTPHHWIRGICKFGILPCNGLLYLPPDQCGCYIDSKLTGFHALAPRRPASSRARGSQGPRLEKGPAYGQTETRGSQIATDGDWPTYRGNAARSGCTPSRVAENLEPAWEVDLGGKLTQPVAAEGRLFVASVDAHVLHALDADSGEPLWTYTAGGRIDSPPTIAGGLAVFGCRDGWVYALRASDGELAWRFRAAPEDRRLVADGQVESVWPVHGSVLVQDGAVYCAAGRSSYIDGGVSMYKLDLMTGATILEQRFDSRDPKTGRTVHLYEPYPAEILPDRELPGVLPDVLSSDGKNIWMRSVTFDRDLAIQEQHPPHLFGSMGYLDDSWWERTYWIYGPHFFSGAAGVHFAKGVSPAGRILIYDESSVYGYQDETFDAVGVFAAGREPTLAKIEGRKFEKAKYRNARKTRLVYEWRSDAPLYVHGLVLAGETIYAAGPPKFDEEKTRAFLTTSRTDDQELIPELQDALDSFEGRKGGVLWALNRADGAQVAEYTLSATPVFDGMIAAKGRLYMATKTGTVLCLSGAG